MNNQDYDQRGADAYAQYQECEYLFQRAVGNYCLAVGGGDDVVILGRDRMRRMTEHRNEAAHWSGLSAIWLNSAMAWWERIRAERPERPLPPDVFVDDPMEREAPFVDDVEVDEEDRSDYFNTDFDYDEDDYDEGE